MKMISARADVLANLGPNPLYIGAAHFVGCRDIYMYARRLGASAAGVLQFAQHAVIMNEHTACVSDVYLRVIMCERYKLSGDYLHRCASLWCMHLNR